MGYTQGNQIQLTDLESEVFLKYIVFILLDFFSIFHKCSETYRLNLKVLKLIFQIPFLAHMLYILHDLSRNKQELVLFMVPYYTSTTFLSIMFEISSWKENCYTL